MELFQVHRCHPNVAWQSFRKFLGPLHLAWKILQKPILRASVDEPPKTPVCFWLRKNEVVEGFCPPAPVDVEQPFPVRVHRPDELLLHCISDELVEACALFAEDRARSTPPCFAFCQTPPGLLLF